MPTRPTLSAIAWVFLTIGMQSFGGGLTAWIRREIVVRRGWMSEREFVGGLALSQITPGPNGVNLSVFVGTSLRGTQGALAALFGMLLVPVIVVLALGTLFVEVRDVPGVESAMAGIGAAAIGMNIANGVRMLRKNIADAWAYVLLAVIALAIGWFNLPLVAVMLVGLPLGLWGARR